MRRILWGGLISAAVLIAGVGFAACTYPFDLPADGGVDGSIDGSKDGAVDSATVDGTTQQNAEASAPGGSSCDASAQCDAGSMCAYPDSLCGSNAPGLCVAIADREGFISCEVGGAQATAAQYCPCGGALTSTPCKQLDDGDDFSINGCDPPDGSFAKCGYAYCGIQTTFCIQSNVDGLTDYACHEFATTVCATHDCACASPAACDGGTCTVDAGAVYVTCN